MRTLTLLTFTGAIALCGSAIAAPSVTPDASNTALTSVHVPGTSYKLRPAEFDGVQGTYNLSNGQFMRITAESRKLYVSMNGQGKSEMVPVAENTFVARDDDMRLVFDQIPFATDVAISRK